MLISVFNDATSKWEIQNYNTMLDVEKWMRDMNKANDFTALDTHKANDFTALSVPRETGLKAIIEQPIDTDAEPDYEQLRAEAIPHLFTTGFLKACKTKPMYNIVLDLLRAGQSPYEVIEWLTGEYGKAQTELQNIARERTNPAHY